MDRWILRSKGVIVEAVQLTTTNILEIAEWTGGRIVEEEDKINNRMYDGLNIPTPHGMKRLSLGMYVVKFGDYFYIAQRGQFESQYQRMTPGQGSALIPVTQSPRDKKVLGKFNGPPWFDGREV